MHLKLLKLAGFKSFVDPTVVHFPSQLVGVVGPNGCGKSNIIDAVRWVMGESSAKNLRGESMSDVIFSGSSTRKSLGQASVELVFDNSLGRVIGPFASYGEISVKRIVTRDGDSQYLLNNARCRRKDITDIFLGTGAGARSYSIIGQGTISRMIEAKPEELRVFLEEAAGVSKYKERRRETLQRIEHTRENLNRVTDIREELETQLQRLNRQAKAAERYSQLKVEEGECRAQIMALKWNDYRQQQLAKQNELQTLALNHEQQQSQLTSASTQRTVLNEQMNELRDQSQTIQTNLYQIGTEIARLEQTIQQQEREQNRLQQEHQSMQTECNNAQEQIQQDTDALEACRLSVHTMSEQVQKLKDEYAQQEALWQKSQNEQQEREARWQEANNAANKLKSELDLTHLNLQHNEQSQQNISLRLEKIRIEQESISVNDLQKAKQELQEQELKLKETQAFDEQEFQQAQLKTKELRTQVEDIEKKVHQLQDAFHSLNSEHAGLIAAQKAARQAGVNKQGIQEWSDKPRLMDVLKVEAKWQTVCDLVLHDSLHAYVVESFDVLLPFWDACKSHGESVVTLRDGANKRADYPSLAEKIKGKAPASMNHLESIYTAENLDQAMSWLPNLLDHESVVTPDGYWFSRGWAKFINTQELDETGILSRQQKIDDLAKKVQALQQEIESARELRDQLRTQLQESSRYIEIFQLNLNSSNEALRTNLAKMSANEQAIEHANRQVLFLAKEFEDLQIQQEETLEKHLALKDLVQQLQQKYQQAADLQQQSLNEKQSFLENVSKQNIVITELRTTMHQSELAYDRELTKVQQYQEKIQTGQERLRAMQQRVERLAHQCQQAQEPNKNYKQQLEQLLAQHAQVDAQLIASREHLSQFKLQLEEQDKITLHYELDLKRIVDLIAQNKLQEQELAVRASAVEESLIELGLQSQEVLAQIPEGSNQTMLEDKLIALAQKIKALGAINLAAIEEFAEAEKRKIYLDEQYNDLHQALATLETAIEKMDKETRTRLESTFEEVNTSFKQLFPRLFGGGKAELELTCDNLLEAGIVVMAQPPGKRNSTIHLLSGGEKAMTAVALVFAIFRLNPSPFCMLDEVDAPLDDVNVGRFCDVVKEMSQFVQFLFITHNKVTMELADHLIGVTMREPGVSRLVAVDVKQALATE